MKNVRASKRPWGLADWFGVAALILLVVCSLILYVRLRATDMVIESLMNALLYGLIGVNVVMLPFLLIRWRHAAVKIVAGVLALILSGGMLYAISAADSVQKALQNISGQQVEEEITYIYVDKDNKDDIGDAVDYHFGALAAADVENTTALLAKLTEGLGAEVTHASYDGVPELVQALYDGEVDGIILNQGYIALLEEMEEYADFSERTRVFYEFTTKREVEPIKPNPAITREPFVVYCSGIDSRRTNINIKSLSDVNIMAIVNPETRQVLLLNTPRDYYLPLVSAPYTGKLDKLTHAGAISIEESMKVLSQLYGVEGDYYIRVNFAGLVQIVDALDGIEVVSETSFTTVPLSVNDKNEKPYTFKEGVNQLDGNSALAFCRERKHLKDGDNQRGRNQMAVIKGIVDKAVSPQILSSYDELLKAVEGCFITNMPYEDMSGLVKMQLKDMRGWNITTYAVSGSGDMEPCATMPGMNLWVMRPNEEMVNIAKGLVQQVINGEVPTLPEK
ncbi:MAG: LytR family transcriptional regulator [Ruminococcaceae bacterium]|nr:LytR family transcriptional regulator [Oscillospiraceae bacterium]